MTVPKILIADSISPRGIEELGRDGALEVAIQTGLSQEQLVGIIPQFNGIVVRSQTKVPAAVVNAGALLRVIGLAMAGFAAALTIVWRFRQLRASDPLSAGLILLGAAIFLRVLFFTFLDATWWIGGYDRYLFPVLPLTSCFFILLIYQGFALRRRAALANV